MRRVCSGCGREVSAGEVYRFRCPEARGDDVDHVLRPLIEREALPPSAELREDFLDPEPNPFLRYRRLSSAYQLALGAGLEPEEYDEVVTTLDTAIRAIDGRGFEVTPFEPSWPLASDLGLGSLWIKDETSNVGGNHKARHLMGLMLWLEIAGRTGGQREPTPLAIASCGNAALAAGIVARAAGRQLEVFVPVDADRSIVDQLRALGAAVTTCRRISTVSGDPCMHRFRECVESGALAFSCQGPENGQVIEGGETLAFEMVSTLLEGGARLDRVFVQVGGGALATAVIGGFEKAVDLGLLGELPKIHTVQTEGASPLARAWKRVADRLIARVGGGEAQVPSGPRERAAWLTAHASESDLAAVLDYAVRHKSSFMWPWEEEPRSIAHAILDDETYDWTTPVRAMLATGGYPLTVTEARLAQAHQLARRRTSIAVDATGSAGLAGCLGLAAAGALGAEESVAVLFTGVERDAARRSPGRDPGI